MAEQAKAQPILVTATVILRVPDVDTNELTALYQAANEIIAKYGGNYDISTTPQNNKP